MKTAVATKPIHELTLTDARAVLWDEAKVVGLSGGAQRLYQETFSWVIQKFGTNWEEKHGSEKLPFEAAHVANKLREYIRIKRENPSLIDYLVFCPHEDRTELVLLPLFPANESCPLCMSPQGKGHLKCMPTLTRL